MTVLDRVKILPVYLVECKVTHNDTRYDVMEDVAYGGLYEVVFEDGSEFGVYGDELVPVEKCEVSKHGIYWVK